MVLDPGKEQSTQSGVRNIGYLLKEGFQAFLDPEAEVMSPGFIVFFLFLPPPVFWSGFLSAGSFPRGGHQQP